MVTSVDEIDAALHVVVNRVTEMTTQTAAFVKWNMTLDCYSTSLTTDTLGQNITQKPPTQEIR